MRKHAPESSLPSPASSSASSFSSSFSSSSASPASSAPPFPSSPRLADAKDPQHTRRVALRQAAAADCGEHSARMQPERRSRSGRRERRRGRKGEREKAKRQVERQAILRLLPRVGGHAQSRGKKKGLALHRHLLRQRHAEKEAAKRPKRRLAVWRSRPASWLLSAASQEVASDTRELVYVSISGEIVPKPRCFQIAREETRFLKAQGITDRPDCSSAIWHPERLPVYRHLRETAFGPAAEARRSPSLPETRQSSRVSTFAADAPVSSSDSPCSAATCSFAYWCLPPSLIKALANRGIHSLYPWQAECLSLALPCFARPDARSSNASSPSLPFPASSSSSPSASGSAAAASPSPASAFPGSSSSPSSVASSVELLIDPGDKKRGRDAGEETRGGAHEAQPGPDEAGKRRRRESCQNEEERGGSQASRLAGRGVDEDEGGDENASCPSSPSTAETIVADDEERESADGELAAEGDSKGKCSNEEARDREAGEKHAAKDGDDEDEDDEDGDDEDGDDGDGDDGDGDDAEDRDRKFNFLKRRKATPTEGSLTGRSLVYCAPTSGGKSLVADLIMVLRCLFAGKRCMYIVPHVSLCREKSEFLHNILFPTLCLRVQAFNASAASASRWFAGIDIAVCTLEQANNILNRLLQDAALIARAEGGLSDLEEKGSDVRCPLPHSQARTKENAGKTERDARRSRRLASLPGLLVQDIGVVVVDEFHTLGEKARGFLVELLLMKIRFLNRFLYQEIQVVAMSATLPNAHELAEWLNAELFTTALRPLALDYFLKCEGAVYRSTAAYLPLPSSGIPSSTPCSPHLSSPSSMSSSSSSSCSSSLSASSSSSSSSVSLSSDSFPSSPVALSVRPQLVRRLPETRRRLSTVLLTAAGAAAAALSLAISSLSAEGMSLHLQTHDVVANRALGILRKSRETEKKRAVDDAGQSKDPQTPVGLPGQQRLLIDEDHLGYLVWETTSEAKSVIVFCATKAWCARSAGFLASRLPLYRLLAAAAWLASPAAVSRLRHMSSSSPPASLSEVLSFSEEAAGEKEIDAQSQASSPLRTASLRGPPPSGDSAASAGPSWLQAVPQPLLEELLLFAPSLFVSPPLQQGREDLLNLLRHAAGPESGLCPVQERAIRAGVAYHHAGLEGTARTAIEIAFQQGVLSVLCATSTLALGVNLPASRVILRSPEIGNETLDVARFRQMAGRAGRTGYTERGEAFLFCSSKQLPACLALISGSPMSRVSLSPPTGLSCPSPNQEALDAISCRQHSFASNPHAETERALKAVPERSLAALAPAVSPAVRTAQDWLAQDGGETFSSSVRSQLQGLHLCRALLESCETLLPLSLLFPSKCFLRGRKISGERERGLGALRAGCGGARLGDRKGNEQTRTCLFSPRENAEEEQEREDGEEEKEESRTEREEEGHLPVISRLFSLVRLCTLRGKQTPRKQMESELHACVAYLHENYLLETRGSAPVSSPARVADGADGGTFVPSESEEAATHKAGEHERERCTDAPAGVSRAWEGGLEGAICMRRFTAFLRRDLEEKRSLYIAAAEEARRAQQTLQTLPEASSEVYIHPESARREQVVVRADATGPGAAVPSPLRRTSSLSPESYLHNHGANFHPSSFSPSSDPLPLSPASSSPSHRASGSLSSPPSCAGSLPVSAASQLPGGDPCMQRRRSLEQASAKAAQDATLLKRQFVLSCREHRGLACTLRRMPHLRSPPLLVSFFLHELSEFSSSSCASPSLYCNAVCSQRVLPRCMHSGDAAVSAVSVGASRPGDEAAEGRKAAEREQTLAETVYACGSPSVPCVRPSALRSISPNAHRAPREMGETPRDKKQTEDGEKALKPADDNAMTVTKTEATEARSSMPAASRSLAVQTPQRMHAQKDAPQGADILSPGLSGSGGGRRDADTNTEEAGPVSGSRTGDKTQKQTETGQSSEQRLQVTQMRRGSSAMLGALAQHAKDEFSRAVSQSFRLPRLLLLKLQLAFSRPTSVASWNPRSSSPSSFRRSYGQGARDRQAGIDESDATLASLSSRTSAGEEQKDGEKNRRSLAARKEKKSERDRARTYERWSQTTFVSCTYLGSAAVETGLNPWEALEAFADLYKAVHQGSSRTLSEFPAPFCCAPLAHRREKETA